jgi:lipopolysaccharide export system permease protein
MIKIIDRQMIQGYFKAYFVCLTSLLSLYIVVDLFEHLDEFTRKNENFVGVLTHICSYYGYQITQIFDRLCEAIILLAAVFTITWMQRCNEQVPLLSAGISTRRIVLPVLVCAWSMLSLAVFNQEVIIPRIANQLIYAKSDPGGDKALDVKGAYEPNLIHITGKTASRKDRLVRGFQCLIPETVSGTQIHLTAQDAYYVDNGPNQRGWELINTHPADLSEYGSWENSKLLEVKDVGRYFLHTREVDFDTVTRPNNWYQFASTYRLYQELQKPESTRLAAMAVLFHIRLTRPLLGMLLVFLGLSVILRDQNRNLIISAGSCLVLCGVFFLCSYGCKMLGENDYLAPALSAWLPLLLFGPLALVFFDAVHT